MKKYTFDDVSRGDEKLYQLALYEVTKGKIVVPKCPKQLFSLQEKVAGKFNYYKDIIQGGEGDLDFIAYQVFSKYGPYAREKDGGEIEYEAITKYITDKDEDDKEMKVINGRANDVLNSLMNKFEKHLRRDDMSPPNYPDFLEDADDDADDLPDFDDFEE